MRQRHSLGLITLGIALLLSSAAAAEAGPLAGRISDQGGTGVVSATVEALTPTGTLVASATTDIDGNYSIALADGTYNVRVTPPGGSGVGPATIFGFTVSGPTALDVVLASSSVAVLTGRLLDANGIGISSQLLVLIPDGGEGAVEVATSDGVGHFEFNVLPGNYRLSVDGTNQSFTFSAPQSFSIQTDVLSLTGTLDADFRLPVNRVDVHVQDPVGPTGVANVGLSTSAPFNCGMTFGPTTACGFSNYTFDPGAVPPPGSVTDANGDETLWLFATPPAPDLYSITAVPPTTSGFGPTSVSGIPVAGATSVTINLVPTLTVDGRLVDGAGAGVPNQTIELFIEGTGLAYSTTTDLTGNYSLRVQPGDYRFAITGDNQGFTLSAPQFYSVSSAPFTLGADRTIDLQVPAVQVNVHVQTAGGVAVANAGLSTTVALNCALVISTSVVPNLTACGASHYVQPSDAVTGAGGDATLWLFPTSTPPLGTYTFTAIPPAGSGDAATSVAGIEFTGSTSVTITLEGAVTLSGTLRGGDAAPLPFQVVELISETSSSIQSITDSLGRYRFDVTPGTYRLSILGDNQAFTVNAPGVFRLFGAPFALTTNTAVDLQLPVKRLTVHVQDSTGTPIANVGVSTNEVTTCEVTFGPATACGGSFYIYFPPAPGADPPPFGVTGADGDLVLWLFTTPTPVPGVPSAYTLTAIPTPDSGFASFQAVDVSLTTDKTVVIILPATHATPVTTLTVTAGDNGDGTFSDPVTIELSATAAPGFTVAQTLYSVDNGGLIPYAGPFNVSGNGDHLVEYLSIDNDGVAEVRQTFGFSIGVPDQTPPTTTATITPDANAAGWRNTAATVTLEADDTDAGSGVAAIHYTVGGGPEVVVPGSVANFTVSAEGTTIVQFFAVDVAGNTEATHSVTIKIDTTAPEVTITKPTSTTVIHTATFKVAWTATDPVSGVTSESATLDGSPVANGATINALGLALGAHTIEVTATNAADLTTTVQKTVNVVATFESLIIANFQMCQAGLITKASVCKGLEIKLVAAAVAHAFGLDHMARLLLLAYIHELDVQYARGVVLPAAYTLLRTDALFVLASLP